MSNLPSLFFLPRAEADGDFMQITLVANENEGSDFTLLFLYLCHSSIAHRPCLLGPCSTLGPGLGARNTEVTLTAAPPPPRLEDPCENAANRQTQIP